jgi:predicted Zn-dependent peptidase
VKLRLLAFAVAVLALTANAVRPAASMEMPDSTAAESWRLANGLEVRTRHVPGMAGVLVTTGYRAGSLYDPAGREGLAEVLAELQFTAAAGSAPARTRASLDSLRSLGWGTRLSPRLAVFSEVAPPGALPAVLAETAARMRGVTVTPASLATAIAAVRRDAGERTFGRPDLGLYHRVRDVALGTSDEKLVARAAGRAFDALTVKDAGQLLRQAYVPANGALAVIGDLSGVDIHQLVEDAFGSVPAGTARPMPAEPALRPGSRSIEWRGISASLGAIGVIAPALDDSLHPAFFISTVFVGGYLREYSGLPAAPLKSRFQYSLFEEPELARFYTAPAATETDPASLGTDFHYALDMLGGQVIVSDAMESVRGRVDWLLGGLLPGGLRQQACQQPYTLEPLSHSMVTRALWRGDAFWDRYRKAFETTRLMPDIFYRWMDDPAHQARLLLVPAK